MSEKVKQALKLLWIGYANLGVLGGKRRAGGIEGGIFLREWL